MRLAPALPLLLACTGPAQSGEVTLELGTGERAFETLDEGETLELVYGPQGGYHVWVSVRGGGFSSDRVLLEVDVVPLSATEPPPAREPVRTYMEPATLPDGTQGQELVGWPAQLARPECLVDAPVSIQVSITDSAGNVASDERTVMLTGEDLPTCE